MSWLEAARGSLRGRLLLALTAGVLTVTTLSFVALHVLIRDGFYGHLDRELELRMRAVAEYAAAHPGEESVAEFMPRFRTRSHQDFFQVWDGSVRTLARSDSSAGLDLPRLNAVAGSPTYYFLVLPDGHRGRAVAQIFALPPDDARGSLTVVTAEETGSLELLENRIHLMLLFVAVITTAATLVIAWYSIHRGLRPVRDLVGSLERVNLDDPRAKVDAGPLPAELRPVAGAFARLLDRLLEALAREQRYARNVAHELVTRSRRFACWRTSALPVASPTPAWRQSAISARWRAGWSGSWTRSWRSHATRRDSNRRNRTLWTCRRSCAGRPTPCSRLRSSAG
jgi:two-component system sensor histidine kinase QseC